MNAANGRQRPIGVKTFNGSSPYLTWLIRFFFLSAIMFGFSASSPAATIHVPHDHSTVQGAIEAATIGDTVLVGEGIYRERIRLKPGITLLSAGDNTKGELGLRRAERTILDGGGEGLNSGVEMAEGTIMDGFTVTRMGRYEESTWQKHHATHGEEQSHEHIGQTGQAGIAVTGVNAVIRHNIVHHNGGTGIALVGVEERHCSPQVLQNICYRNMGAGIGSMKGSQATIRGNLCFENFYAGIGQSGASPYVVDNVCHGNIRAGIGISEGAQSIVSRNRCYANRRAGIGIRTGVTTRPIVQGNHCYENDMAGIGIRDDAAPVVKGNHCYRNKLAGIGMRRGARPILVDNECYENQLAGIGHEAGVTSVLLSNHVHHNRTAGIGFEGGVDGEATLINNRVIDNAKVAVGIHSGWTVRLSGNELSRQEGIPPVVMIFEGAVATLIDNVVRGPGVAGIRVAGEVTADRNRFEGVGTKERGPGSAIWALTGSRVTMTGNDIRGWRQALQASEAEILAAGNRVAQFQGTAFVVHKSNSPAHVYDNQVETDDPKARVLTIDGSTGRINGNELRFEK
jgi:hypothetical protein